MHHTKDKGDIGVLSIAADLSQQGLKVMFPACEHLPFDLVAYDEATSIFYRIQCKYRVAAEGSIVLKLKTCYGTKHGVQTARYELGSFDVLALYNPELNSVAYMRELDLQGLQNSVTVRTDGKGRTFESLRDFPR